MDEIKGKLGENVRTYKDDALMTKKLATIKRDVPLEYSMDDLKYEEPDLEELIRIYQELQFNSFISRIRNKGGDKTQKAVETVSTEDSIHELADKIKTVPLDEFLEQTEAGSNVVFWMDTDDNHLQVPSATRVALLSPDKKLFSINPVTPLNLTALLGQVAQRKYKFTGFSLKPAAYTMIMAGMEAPEWQWDIMIAEYLIDPNQSGYSVEKWLPATWGLSGLQMKKERGQGLQRKKRRFFPAKRY